MKRKRPQKTNAQDQIDSRSLRFKVEDQRWDAVPQEEVVQAPELTVQAHEASLILYQTESSLLVDSKDGTIPGRRGGLIQWGDSSEQSASNIWFDRFDARLLLDTLPTTNGTFGSTPLTIEDIRHSPDETWEDLPSDSEDTFFLSPKEIEGYYRDKRMRKMEENRQERMRLIQEGETQEEASRQPQRVLEAWGDSEEVPDAPQMELMRRVANHIRSSPNPTQLEMRILANHGADDPRFAFLKGRWKNIWEALKKDGQASGNIPSKAPQVMNALADYGSSEEDDTNTEGLSDGEKSDHQASTVSALVPSQSEELQRQRRERLAEWKQKHRKS